MKSKKGFVLVVVLVIVALLISLVTLFVSEVYLENSSTRSSLESTQGSLFASGGISAARQALVQELSGRSYNSLLDAWATPVVLRDTEGQGSLRIGIEDESGKFNLNTLVLPDGSINEASYAVGKRLFMRLHLPMELLNTIADWIDPDDQQREGGAEARWYQSMPQPYRPRNAPMRTLEELKRLKGVEPFYETLRPYVTVYDEYPAPVSQTPVNINTAPEELLMALDERITPDLAALITRHRKEKPFQHPAELGQVPGMAPITPALLTRISTKGSVFSVNAEASVQGTTRRIEAVVRVTGATTATIYWREY